MTNTPNHAYFAITDLAVPLPENWYFHDEGASKLESNLDLLIHPPLCPQTIPGRSLEIVRAHIYNQLIQEGIPEQEAIIQAQHEAFYQEGHYQRMMSRLHESGVSLLLKPLGINETHIHMLYLDEGRQDLNTFIRGHEEQHCISYIPGALALLEEKITQHREKPIRFNKIKDEELAADCNGIHALVTHNYDLDPVQEHYIKNDPINGKQFAHARYIYENDEYNGIRFEWTYLKSKLKI